MGYSRKNPNRKGGVCVCMCVCVCVCVCVGGGGGGGWEHGISSGTEKIGCGNFRFN